jgi:hypothetical protein
MESDFVFLIHCENISEGWVQFIVCPSIAHAVLSLLSYARINLYRNGNIKYKSLYLLFMKCTVKYVNFMSCMLLFSSCMLFYTSCMQHTWLLFYPYLMYGHENIPHWVNFFVVYCMYQHITCCYSNFKKKYCPKKTGGIPFRFLFFLPHVCSYMSLFSAYKTNWSHVCSMKVMYVSCMRHFGHVC